MPKLLESYGKQLQIIYNGFTQGSKSKETPRYNNLFGGEEFVWIQGVYILGWVRCMKKRSDVNVTSLSCEISMDLIQ